MRAAALELIARIAMTDAAPEYIRERARAILAAAQVEDALRGWFG